MIRRIVEGRAARVCAAAVTVFLCALTLLEFTALELEWEIPVLQVVSGEGSFWSEEYQREELALDESAENVLLEEPGSSDGGTDGGAEATGENSGGEAVAEENSGGQVAAGEDSGGQAAGKENADGTAAAGENPGGADTGETGNAQGAGGTETGSAAGTSDKENAGSASGNGKDTGNVDGGGADAEFPYYIRVNRKQNCITVYTLDQNGEYTVPYKAIICSTGLYNATPRGTFQLSTKYLWRELYGGVYGQYATRIYGGVLFHSVPYYRKSKDSLCTDKYNKLGQQASMGCIRLTVEDAKWIAENCPSGTTVEIYDDDDPGPLGKPEAMKIDTDSPNKGWDPTDPDEDNPWNDLSEDE